MSSDPSSVDSSILFIGNSYTARNDLPRLIAELALAAPKPRRLHVQSIVAGGASLRRHWNAGAARTALEAVRWDHVVLQEQSTLPVKNRARYHENVRLFAAEIAKNGARTALYLTWARQNAPETQDAITRAVEDIAAEIDARVVPVGRAWQMAASEMPDLQLYVADGSHPSPAGSFLAACVFHVSVYDEPPAGHAVAESRRIPADVAVALQALAWRCRS
jgi:hypothetical protein